MYPQQFQYYEPKSVKEASDLLKKFSGESKVLAGGMSLIPVLKLRISGFEHIIDISSIEGLSYIEEKNNSIEIGSLTTHADVGSSELILNKAPLMTETALHIGDPQVRNMGTIGGSLCHADPSGDWGAALIAMRGSVTASNSRGSRDITSDEFFLDSFITSLEEDEILSAVKIPIYGQNSSGSYVKLERRAGDFAVLGVAAQLSLDSEGVCTYVGVGLTALGATNIRSVSAEEVLKGQKVTSDLISDAANASRNDMDPLDDLIRGSVEYRTDVGGTYVKRALMSAFGKIGGS